jgi:superfamily II DNA or RNA helicase
VREEFGKGNEFAQKITYKATGASPRDLIQEFRNSYYPRIVVTVDLIATGTDIRPVEIVVFMRSVKSRVLFEQMKGRGVRVINPDELKAVTPDARAKTHFLIVDCVGVTEHKLSDTRPLERNPTVSLRALLDHMWPRTARTTDTFHPWPAGFRASTSSAIRTNARRWARPRAAWRWRQSRQAWSTPLMMTCRSRQRGRWTA